VSVTLRTVTCFIIVLVQEMCRGKYILDKAAVTMLRPMERPTDGAPDRWRVRPMKKLTLSQCSDRRAKFLPDKQVKSAQITNRCASERASSMMGSPPISTHPLQIDVIQINLS
jgi:hypothetical protein